MSLLVTDNMNGTWTISCGGSVVTVGSVQPAVPQPGPPVLPPIVAGGGGVVIKLRAPDVTQVAYDPDIDLTDFLRDRGPIDTRNLILTVKTAGMRQVDLGALFTEARSMPGGKSVSVYLSDDE
jgi:hypothetical protein